MKKLILILLSVVVLISCSDSGDDSSNGTSDNFDRGAILQNVTDNIIIPAFQDLSSDLNTLKSSKDIFISNPNISTLQDIRADWLTAYKTWQYVEMFNIGMAEETLYSFQMNIYPTNISDIQNNMINGNYDLTSNENNDAVGFPAVDYLLFGTGNTDTDIVNFYSSDLSASQHQQYLSDLIDQMDNLTTAILTDWTNSFRDTFISSTDNTASSSVNMLINDFIFYYEKGLRANKIGIPAGVFSATPLDDKVEGFYSEVYSKELALEALNAVQNFFNGQAYNSTSAGTSFADYVTELRTNSGSSDLTSTINNQLDIARTEMIQLEDNFSNQITTDNTRMLATYDELQRVVVLLKIDMLQTLNISVDFVDADGD